MSGTDDHDLAAAVASLRVGGLVAFPTETVYGLGADAANPVAVRRIFEVKGRPPTHPVIVHISWEGELSDWAREVPEDARVLADACWPGPLTLLLRRAPSVSDVVTGGRPTVGVRVPGHPLALALLQAFGGGVAAPSANRFGRVSPTTAAHVRFELGSAVDVVLDGGPCQVGVESTIVDLSGGEPIVRRPGGVPVEELERLLGRTVEVWSGSSDVAASPAPGSLASHYAPSAVVVVVDEPADAAAGAALSAEEGRRVALLAPSVVDGLHPGVIELEPAGAAEHFAHVLYDRLREADRLGVDELWVVPPPAAGLGAAVRDRLRRAATR